MVDRYRPERRRGISGEAIVLALICFADLISTVILIENHGAVEANPMMAFYLQWGIVPFCIAKLFFVIPPIALAEWYRKYNDRLMRATLRWVSVAYIAIYVVATLQNNSPRM